MRSHRKSNRWNRLRRVSFALAVSLAPLVFGGCSGDEGAANPIGTPGGRDRPENGSVAIDEAGLTARVEGAKLVVSIPVTSKVDARAVGQLRVALRAVDDASEVSSTPLAYALLPLQTTTLSAEIGLPTGLAKQSDLVRYVVRITEDDPSGIVVRKSLLYALSRYSIGVEGPSTVTKGRKVSYRVRAEDPLTKRPIAGQAVRLSLAKQGGTARMLDGTTGADGAWVVEVTPDETGAYVVGASTSAAGTSAEATGAVTVQDAGTKILLTTDKPIYQPGQTIHLRSLSLLPQASTPVAGASLVFEVDDGKGNKIVKRTAKTDAWGIASTDVAIASQVNEGAFKLRVIEGGVTAEKTVEVKPYALPKLKVAVSADQPYYLAGQTLSGVVQADYFFGKPVGGGDVKLEAATLDVGQTVFQSVLGRTDASGRFEFQVKLPSSLVGLPIDHGNAVVSLHATVTDTAGQAAELTRMVSVAKDAVDVVLVPDATTIVPGVDNRLDLFVSDPTGAPLANAACAVDVPGATLTGTTDAFGYASFAFAPTDVDATKGVAVTTHVTPAGGATVVDSFAFGVQDGAEHLVVRTDRAVYATGDAVKVDVATSKDVSRVYVDWSCEGQTVDMRTLDVVDGKASFTANVDPTTLGSNRVDAYVVDDVGNLVRTGRSFVVRKSGALRVDVTADKPLYAPGQSAKLKLSVKDETGAPTVAALGVQIVDEAVFGLVDAQPGLLRTYFELEDAFSKPQYEIEGPIADLPTLLFDDTASSDAAKAGAAQTRAAATLAALGGHAPLGVSTSSWPTVVTAANGELATYYQKARAGAVAALTEVVRVKDLEIRAQGCDPSQYWCASLGRSYVDELHARVVEASSLVDFWGNPWNGDASSYGWELRFVVAGPDEKVGTSDDWIATFSWEELGVTAGYYPGEDASAGGGAAGGMGGSGGSGGSAGNGGTGGAAGGGGDGPRVRRDFPETLFFDPAIITGPDGDATIDVTMADSITTWRVSALASSAMGKLGAGLSGVTVFQDFFVDVSFPASLTRGDEVAFPIAVYNYLSEPESVVLALDAGDWYTPLGATTVTVDLAAGEVKGVRFPVRVESVGLRTLTVRAQGTHVADAVARTVRVVPDGKPVVASFSGNVPAAGVSESVTFPATAVPGSSRLLLDVYPAFLAQVVSGMDSMLQVPNGCFEQTTSTTWPNVLVTSYMKSTGQLTTAIELKADSLISAGYQRLLTFEHGGGGFSWFGEQDPAPNVSVTAFGVMEFADMRAVHLVDDAMLARTIQWLAGRQASSGAWEGEQTEFFSFQTSAVRNTAFVVAALASAGYAGPEIAKGVAYLEGALDASPDAYTLALVTEAVVTAAPTSAFATTLLARLDAAKTVDGEKVRWNADDTQTNFYATGSDASVSATAIATHAMLSAGGYPSTAGKAIAWLVSQRDANGNFGSTQATIWTLRALIVAATKGTDAAVGVLDVLVDGVKASTLSLARDQSDVTTTLDLGSLATTGDHVVSLAFAGTGSPSFHLVAGYNVPWAGASEPPGPLGIEVAYDRTSLALDETVGATVTVTNREAVVEHMVLVTVGIPPGFAVVTDDFADELAAGTISRFESTGKQLIFYVPTVAPGAPVVVGYRLRATMPVTVEDGGGEVHPYYEPEARSTTPSQKLVVTGS